MSMAVGTFIKLICGVHCRILTGIRANKHCEGKENKGDVCK